MQHQPNIFIEDDLSSVSFTVRDSTILVTGLALNNPVLEVMVPGSTASVIFTDIIQGFQKVLHVYNLHLDATGSVPAPPLPDGNYYLRYSVAPNARLFVEYNYYRTVKLQAKWHLLVNYLLGKKCDMNSANYDKKVRELTWLKYCIDNIKYTAESLHNVSRADQMYTEIDNILHTFKACERC